MWIGETALLEVYSLVMLLPFWLSWLRLDTFKHINIVLLGPTACFSQIGLFLGEQSQFLLIYYF